MSTYIDSMIILILSVLLYYGNGITPVYLTCFAVLFALFCFCLVTTKRKLFLCFAATAFIISFWLPHTAIFLPMFCYLCFCRKYIALPGLYLIPILCYPGKTRIFILLLTGLSFYLAYENQKRTELEKSLNALRDTSTEEELLLHRKNRQLLEQQNDQIYIATLQERNRIAREIHDNVGHLLTRCIMQVGALLTICNDEQIRPHLELLKQTLDTAMNNIRNSVHDLHDESIDLKQALTQLAENYEFCEVSLTCEVSGQIPKDVKYCFLAMTKEALNNTMKHSNATSVTVTMREHPAFYQLLIEDNGTVFPPAKARSGNGIGLSNMTERVHALSGIIHISNENGFRIFASIPKK